MDFFDQPYYRENKQRLSWVGQWPFDNTIKKHAILITSIVMLPATFGKICCLLTSLGDMDLFFDSFPLIVGNLAVFLKMYTFYVKSNEVQGLLESIKDAWDMLKTTEEMEIMRWYTERGRIISNYYSCVWGGGLLLTAVVPVAPRLIFHVGNMSAPRPLPHHLYYFVDNEDHYYPILVHSYMSIVLTRANLAAIDAIFIVFIQHACGIFSILQCRLENLVENKDVDMNVRPPIEDDVHYCTVRECIVLHNVIISYMEVMESVYHKAFFRQSGMNMIIMSLAAFRAVSMLDSPQVLTRQLILSVVKLLHLYLECDQCQQIIDKSLYVRTSLANSTWYLTSFRTRKLINFMIVRSQLPCTLTAGKLFVVSMEFCGVVMRTSMSYFTVLRNVG